MLVRGVGADCRPEKYRHLEQAKWSVLNVEELPLCGRWWTIAFRRAGVLRMSTA